MSIAVMPSPSHNREIGNPWPPLAPMRRAHTPRWVVRDWLALGAVSVLGVGAANLMAGALDGFASLSLLSAAFAATLVGAHRSTRPTQVYFWAATALVRIAAVDLALLLSQQLGAGLATGVLAAACGGALLAGRSVLARNTSPVVDGFYWTRMLLVSALGTALAGVIGLALGQGEASAALATLAAVWIAARLSGAFASSLSHWAGVVVIGAAGAAFADLLCAKLGSSACAVVAALVLACVLFYRAKDDRRLAGLAWAQA